MHSKYPVRAAFQSQRRVDEVTTSERTERRSPDSVLARTAVTAKEEAEALQSALEATPGRRFRRRAKLSRSLEDARRREREALAALRGAIPA